MRDDLALLGCEGLESRPARVAITSYEFTGLVRNGGIGTACSLLAASLAEDGHEVDVVFTGWQDDPSDDWFERWSAHYEDLGATLLQPDVSGLSHCDAALYNAVHSFALYRLLAERDHRQPYDVIHFVESLGHGLYSLAAKRQGLAFHEATTVVGVHSPRRWLAEAHGMAFDQAIELGDDHMERRSVELADVVVAPSAHMLDWLERRGVELPPRSYVQQYVTSSEADSSAGDPVDEGAAASPQSPSQPIDELVFFGRLEPRKGLIVFCDALDRLARREESDRLERVTFLGKEVPFGQITSGDYVRARARDWPWEVDVVGSLDREAAHEHLRQPGRLAVMASSMDNSPNTVYEAIGLGIAFLASRGGGTAELVHPDDFERVTYDPRDELQQEIDPADPGSSRPKHTGRVLESRLLKALRSVPAPVRYAIDPSANREAHLAWHRAVAAKSGTSEPLRGPALTPLSIRELADGADGADALLLLVDPEVETRPELADALTAAAASESGAGFITSLGSFDVDTPEGPVRRLFLPVGGPPAAGLLGNCAGTGVVVARREALDRIGAFDDDRLPVDFSVADLLAEAALAGERIDVVPSTLYHLPAKAVPGGSLVKARGPLETLRPYCRALGPQASEIVAVARRALEEEEASRLRAERAERELATANQRMAIIVASRSWRLTGLLRRPMAGARKLAWRSQS